MGIILCHMCSKLVLLSGVVGTYWAFSDNSTSSRNNRSSSKSVIQQRARLPSRCGRTHTVYVYAPLLVVFSLLSTAHFVSRFSFDLTISLTFTTESNLYAVHQTRWLHKWAFANWNQSISKYLFIYASCWGYVLYLHNICWLKVFTLL